MTKAQNVFSYPNKAQKADNIVNESLILLFKMHLNMNPKFKKSHIASNIFVNLPLNVKENS